MIKVDNIWLILNKVIIAKILQFIKNIEKQVTFRILLKNAVKSNNKNLYFNKSFYYVQRDLMWNNG